MMSSEESSGSRGDDLSIAVNTASDREVAQNENEKERMYNRLWTTLQRRIKEVQQDFACFLVSTEAEELFHEQEDPPLVLPEKKARTFKEWLRARPALVLFGLYVAAFIFICMILPLTKKNSTIIVTPFNYCFYHVDSEHRTDNLLAFAAFSVIFFLIDATCESNSSWTVAAVLLCHIWSSITGYLLHHLFDKRPLVGSSGLVYGLWQLTVFHILYMIIRGKSIFTNTKLRWAHALIGAAVVVLMQTVIIFSFIPAKGVSHLCHIGGAVGAVVAYIFYLVNNCTWKSLRRPFGSVSKRKICALENLPTGGINEV